MHMFQSIIACTLNLIKFIYMSPKFISLSVIFYRDMYGQAEMLVKRMKGESNIDYENDWKVITIFIGGNDLCAFCKDKVSISVLIV